MDSLGRHRACRKSREVEQERLAIIRYDYLPVEYVRGLSKRVRDTLNFASTCCKYLKRVSQRDGSSEAKPRF